MKKITFVILFLVLYSTFLYAQATENANGYKGVPWGADFDRFKEIKNYDDAIGETTNDLLKDYNWNNCLAVILGTPVYTETLFGTRMKEVKFRHVPKKFNSVSIKKDDVDYIFYEGKFAMAFSELYAKNYDKIYNSLSKKYKVSNTISKDVMTKGVPPKHDIVSISATLFKGTATNVFLIKQKYSTPSMGIRSTSVGILYISDKYYKLIKSEINKSIAVESKGKSKKDKKDLDSDIDKIK